MMQWEQLLSLKRFGDTTKRLRIDQDESRLGFEVDYDRIIFSAAFRSLQDKTQVIPLSRTDFVHTRLTHSLEVSVVGRSLGRLVGKKILEKYPHLESIHGFKPNDFGIIVAAASLAHDIGNPPFGHSGEKAIGEYFSVGNGMQFKDQLSPKEWQDLIDFEGNANGFSVVNNSILANDGGIRLTYATLGAFMKYPKESLPKKPTQNIADKKYGFFQNDKELFMNVANELGLISNKNQPDIGFERHPLTYLVEAADDICYTIIDFEDGINLGWIPEEFAIEYLVKIVQTNIDKNKYYALPTKSERIAYLRALAIGSLIQDAVQVFMDNETKILKGEFPYAISSKSKYKAQMEDIIKVSVQNIYKSKEVVHKEIQGYNIINNILDHVVKALNNHHNNCMTNYDHLIMQLLPSNYQEVPESLYKRLLMACNYVSLLTDGNALNMNNLLKK